MNYKTILFGLLFIGTPSVAAQFKHEPISSEAASYVEQALKFDELLKVCGQYNYEVLASSVKNYSSGVEIVTWTVVDFIGTKMDQHIYGFKTTDGKVTSELRLVHESEDWHYYLDECKIQNKAIK